MQPTFIKSTTESAEQPFVCDAPNELKKAESTGGNLKYMIVGIAFGVVFVKGEIIS